MTDILATVAIWC